MERDGERLLVKLMWNADFVQGANDLLLLNIVLKHAVNHVAFEFREASDFAVAGAGRNMTFGGGSVGRLACSHADAASITGLDRSCSAHSNAMS